jgi:hypothetical protein
MDGFMENNLKQIGLPQQRMPMQQPMQNLQSPAQVTEFIFIRGPRVLIAVASFHCFDGNILVTILMAEKHTQRYIKY